MNTENLKLRSQIIYLSHGGGPLPILNEPSHKKMIQFMKSLPNTLKKPESIVVFSAHWEENTVTIQSGDHPELMYDYTGFPKAAYELKYPCKGNQELAIKIANLLENAHINCSLDEKKSYDHGAYIPLKLMYPEGDIPVLQVSLNHNLDPLTHINIGKALRPLLNENILFIGSGFSFHNMNKFDFYGKDLVDSLNNQFQDKLIEICCHEKNEKKRFCNLINWEDVVGARYAHPREEHLLPLLVCVGLSEGIGTKIFDDYILGKRASAFLWRQENI